MFHNLPPIIANAVSAKESEQRVMDGIIRTTLFTAQQRASMDGIIRTGLTPEKKKMYEPHIGVEPSKTKQMMGTVHMAGSRFH